MGATSTILYVTGSSRATDIESTLAVLEDAFPDVETRLVRTPDQCLQHLSGNGASAVVTEYDLGEQTGLDLVDAIADRPSDPPVILYTADPSPDLVEAAYARPNTAVVQRDDSASAQIVAEALRDDWGPPSEEDEAEAARAQSDSTVSFSSHFEALVETAPNAFVTIDTDSTIQFANSEVETVFGYATDDLVGEPLTKLMDEGLAAQHLAAIDRYLETGDRTLNWDYVELTGQHRDGHAVPIGVSFAEFTKDGERYFTGIIRDITERKRRERELERYGTVMDTVSDGIYALDEDDRFVAVNDAYTELTGYSREELLGEPAATVIGEDLASELEEIQASLEADDETATLETHLPTKGGESVPIEVRISPFRLGDDAVGRVGVVRDTSEREALESEVRKQRGLTQQIIDTTPVGLLVLDEAGTPVYLNERTEEIAGVSRDRLGTDAVEFEFTDPDGNEVPSEELPFAQVIEDGRTVYGHELGVTRPDGEHVWLSVNGSPLETDEGVLGVFTLQDVTDAKQRASRLEALNETAQQLPNAETATAVCEATLEAATDVLDLPYSYLLLYDETDGELEVAAQTEDASQLVDDPLLGDIGQSPVWDAFIRDDARIIPDFGARAEQPPNVGSAGIFPLGEHGVFVTVCSEPDGFQRTDLLLAKLLSATARTSLDRAAREADLREQRDTLEQQNERLDRVNRVNRAIRDITQVLIQADTHEEIEQLVCERLAAIDPYSFVWVGDHDPTVEEVRPVASAGDGNGYLDVVDITTDDSATGLGPAGRAIETKRPQVQNNILQADSFAPWREEALSRGFRASISVPLMHRDTLYGILNLYATKPLVFEQMETTVLEELGRMIGYAMNAIERKKALVSESSVELRFDVPTLDAPFLGFIDGQDGEYALQNTVQRLDGHIHLFFTVRDIDPEVVRAQAEASRAVDRFTLISEDDDECLCECTIQDSTFISTVLERGAVFETIRVEDESAELTVRLPQSADVREFVGYVQESLGAVELVARRESDDPVMTRQEFENEVRNRLTERQDEVIQTAYFSGFFEWPRKSTGQEVAELLDVTQPTVNRHIRAGERTLFGLLFDE